MAFSQNFLNRLKNTTEKLLMTPDKFIRLFENYVSNNTNAEIKGDKCSIYVFMFPLDMNFSTPREECLQLLEKNLLDAGFRHTPKQMYSQMSFQQMTFFKYAPHICDFGCQKDGYCNIREIECSATDIECKGIRICL